MYKKILFITLFFILFSCSKSQEETTVIQDELKNQNVVDQVTNQKTTQVKADFQKDLDALYNSLSGSTN